MVRDYLCPTRQAIDEAFGVNWLVAGNMVMDLL
jgi:hypothetical protein